jgi:formate C-acetyltransferase
VYLSRVLGPSPDGRKLDDFLASNASPQPGAAKLGPTAVAKSLTKLDLSEFPGGAMLNMKFAPSTVQDREGKNGFKSLINTYFALGGLQIQMNVVSSGVLREAQQNPQAHKDLIVRVWGFSTYFVSLPKDYQDQLINETEMAVH